MSTMLIFFLTGGTGATMMSRESGQLNKVMPPEVRARSTALSQGGSAMPELLSRKQSLSAHLLVRSLELSRHVRFIVVTILSILLLSYPATSHAARTRPVNLEAMTQRADRIVSGRCVRVQVARDRDLGQVVTYVTFALHRLEKGDIRGSLTIKVLGDQDEESLRTPPMDGVPTFRKGEEVVLFLYGNSRHGLTSPVGFGQGKFTLVKDKRGRSLALNQFANEGLFRGLSPGALQRLGRRNPKLQDNAWVSPDDLLDLVQALRK